MNVLIVDANVAVKWVVEEVGSDAAAALADRSLAAPSILMAECAHALLVKARRGEITTSEAYERITMLHAAPIELVPCEDFVDEAARLAMDISYSVNGCLYLALAARWKVPLITADEGLVERARRHLTRPLVLLLGTIA